MWKRKNNFSTVAYCGAHDAYVSQNLRKRFVPEKSRFDSGNYCNLSIKRDGKQKAYDKRHRCGSSNIRYARIQCVVCLRYIQNRFRHMVNIFKTDQTIWKRRSFSLSKRTPTVLFINSFPSNLVMEKSWFSDFRFFFQTYRLAYE